MDKMTLLKLIGDYLFKVKYVHKLFEEEYGICNPLRAYRSGILDQEGYIDMDKKVKYMFHGIGCKISFLNNGLVVDFDYGPDMEINGFDPWRILKFIKSQSSFDKVNLEMLKISFKYLEDEGKIIGPKGHGLDTELYFLLAPS